MKIAFLVLAAVCALPVLGADEAFVLVDGRTGKRTVENAARAATRFAPCSTFKIPNSAIALESGVVPDEMLTLQYDPKRDGDQSGAWARDHDLRSAFKTSVAWYYQEMARRVGPGRMQKYLDQFAYGDRSMGGGIDRFWLGGGLRISAEEQIAFLERLNDNKLGISLRTSAILHDILLLETTDTYRWYGKTGTCTDANAGPVAWHVGFVEREGKTSYYALNFGGSSISEVFQRRKKLIREKLSAAGLIDAAAPTPRRQMEARVRTAIASFPGKVTLYAKNLETGEAFGVQEKERVRTASTIKLPIMAAVFSLVAEGKAKWDERITLHDADKVGGSGVLHEFSDGVSLPLRDLVHLMITVSDNTATNLVIDRVTADFVNAEAEKLGLHDTRSMRKVLGNGPPGGYSREGRLPEYQRFGLGMSSPYDMGQLLEKIERGEVVSKEASKEMLAILKNQQFKTGIGRQLPGEIVASKSGSLDRLRSDVGIVYSTGGRMVIAVTVDGMLRTDYSPDNGGELLISRLTGMLLDGLSAPVSDIGDVERTVELKGATGHIQGIEVSGERLWATWVNAKEKTGHLGLFELSTGKLIKSVALEQGERFHPGGIAADGDSLWVPVAEYKPKSSAIIQRRNKNTLALEAEFAVQDHIGCVTVMNGQVYGGNWDSRQIYKWDRTGKFVAVMDNPSGTGFQDMKAVGPYLVGGGVRSDGGAIDWLDPNDLHLIKRIRTGKANSGVLLTREGMAIYGGKLYLAPEDLPGRVFVFTSFDE